MAHKAGNSFRNIGPLGKARTPPLIVFRNGMELRQIKRYQLDQRIVRRRQSLLMFLIVRTRADIGSYLSKKIQGNYSSAAKRRQSTGLSSERKPCFEYALKRKKQRLLPE